MLRARFALHMIPEDGAMARGTPPDEDSDDVAPDALSLLRRTPT